MDIAVHLVFRITVTALALTTAVPAAAQSYPERPVRFIIGLTAGSSNDITLRIIAQKLAESWGQNAIVDNRPGAGGNIAADLVAKAPPDGYTLQFGNISISIAHSYYRKLPYNALTDLAPVSLVSSFPQIVSVNPSMPVHSIKDLIALAKSRPGEVLFSSVGNGQADHMAGELFAYMAGVKMTHVPYKGGPQALGAVTSGEVALGFQGLPVAISQIRTGKVRALAVTTAKRTPALPELPTVAESGVPGYEHSIWAGVFAPAGTPQSIIAKVSDDIARLFKLSDVQKRLAQLDIEIVGSTPAEFDKFFKADVAKWAKLLKATGIQGD